MTRIEITQVVAYLCNNSLDSGLFRISAWIEGCLGMTAINLSLT